MEKLEIKNSISIFVKGKLFLERINDIFLIKFIAFKNILKIKTSNKPDPIIPVSKDIVKYELSRGVPFKTSNILFLPRP
jgi:hypothetical protein